MLPKKPVPKQKSFDYSSLKRHYIGRGTEQAKRAVQPLRKMHPSAHFTCVLEANGQRRYTRAGIQSNSVVKGIPPRWQNQDLLKELSLLPGKEPSQHLPCRVSSLP